jgi:hypothetical protein
MRVKENLHNKISFGDFMLFDMESICCFKKNRGLCRIAGISPEIINFIFYLSAIADFATQQLLSADIDGYHQYTSCRNRRELSYCPAYQGQ